MVKSLCDEDQSRPEKEKEESMTLCSQVPSATFWDCSEDLVSYLCGVPGSQNSQTIDTRSNDIHRGGDHRR